MKKTNQPLVSVIMPCLNDGAYIEEAVSSLREQTWPQVELVIIDDGSDEETVQVIRQLSFPRKIVLHTNHIGPAAARNRGIQAAQGIYILPLDSDDIIEKTYIEQAVAMMQSLPDAGVVYCHADLFGEKTGAWDLPEYSLKAELLDNVIFVTALFRKSDWEDVGGFCEDFRAGMEDYDFWLSLLETGKCVYQLPETLFHYRIKPASRTTRFQRSYADVQDTYVRLYRRHRAFFQKHSDLYCMELRRYLIDQLMINKRLNEELEELKGSRETKAPDLLALTVDLSDPLIRYIASVRLMKPKLARKLENLLSLKDKGKKLIGRK